MAEVTQDNQPSIRESQSPGQDMLQTHASSTPGPVVESATMQNLSTSVVDQVTTAPAQGNVVSSVTTQINVSGRVTQLNTTPVEPVIRMPSSSDAVRMPQPTSQDASDITSQAVITSSGADVMEEGNQSAPDVVALQPSPSDTVGTVQESDSQVSVDHTLVDSSESLTRAAMFNHLAPSGISSPASAVLEMVVTEPEEGGVEGVGEAGEEEREERMEESSNVQEEATMEVADTTQIEG